MIARTLAMDIHQSWLIAFACVGIVLGVALAQHERLEMFGSLAWLLTGVAILLFSMVRARRWVVPLVVLAGGLVGVWRGLDEAALSRGLDTMNGETVTIRGSVSEDGDTDARGNTILRLKDVRVNGRQISGMLWLTTERTDRIQRSDHVTATGTLSQGFGTFGASMYSARITAVTREQPGDIALSVRNWFGEGVRRAIGEPEASLGLGYLVGQRRGLPSELDTALQAAGLTHIVVASGYNLTVLVRFARKMFEKISKFVSLAGSSAMIIAFIAVTGMSASMSRAGLVAGLSLLAWYYGRSFHPLVLLPFAMAITVMVQPTFAWGDVGWQLSFAAFAGVMILAPLVQAYFFGDKKEHALRRIFVETVSAQLFTLPILLLYFGQFSVVAPVANMLILPLVPLAMILTFIAGIGAYIVPFAVHFVGVPAELVLTYMTTTAHFIGGLSWALQELEVTVPIALGMFGVLIAACVYLSRATRLQLERTSLVE